MTATHERPNRFGADTPWFMRGNFSPIDDEATVASLPVQDRKSTRLNSSH